MLTAVRYGATECQAVLVVRADSGIRSAKQLAGRRASWVDPLSTSGHLMALAHLRDLGLDPDRLFVSQRFAGSYRDALIDVVEGRADVTSVFVVAGEEKATMRELVDLAGPGARGLTLLSTTAPAPYDALVITRRAKLPDVLEGRLLALDQRISPPAMLLEVCRADRFLRVKPQAYASLERFVHGFLL
jgi:phosphonate transport system substrate-binding protein